MHDLNGSASPSATRRRWKHRSWLGVLALVAGAIWLIRPEKIPDALPVATQAPPSVDVDADVAVARIPHVEVAAVKTVHPAPQKSAFVQQPREPLRGDGAQLVTSYKASASAGDGDAAFSLFQVLYECGALIANAAAMTQVDCAGVSVQEIAEAERYLKIAADAGNTDAQLRYGAVALARFADATEIARHLREFEQTRDDSMRYLNSAASAGSVDAMLILASTYSDGLLSDKDSVRAYAYWRAVQLTGINHVTENMLAQVAAGMSAAQVQQARALGQSIFSTCCH